MNKVSEKLFDKKWAKFLKYRSIFSFIPFLDFVIASGSLALGKVNENSDFDVIIGARAGRIFTVRFFCFLFFEMLGIRRDKLDKGASFKDKICFNHFVTKNSYKLRPPHNLYWEELYQNLVPVFGKREVAESFLGANDFLIKGKINSFERFRVSGFNFLRFFLESILDGRFGDFIEKKLKGIQLARIEKTLVAYGTGFQPRLRYDDEELEFHPDNIKHKSYYL